MVFQVPVWIGLKRLSDLIKPRINFHQSNSDKGDTKRHSFLSKTLNRIPQSLNDIMSILPVYYSTIYIIREHPMDLIY